MSTRRRVSSGGPWEDAVGYSRAVRVGDLVVVAGTTAAAEGGGAVGGDDPAAQTREALRRVAAALEQLGASLADVVRTRMYVTDISRWAEVGRVHGEVFADVRPAATMVEVSRLIDPALLVEVEVDAVVPPAAPPA
ncbi:RidA family protein [Microlunatus capsulatus]|uniref:Enamine deaminase RidA (YjgF/YER057c/UK114 family) n=1 Tax=Microlunatus capsulatus TaxID=99117 RepID=A0ABS4ZB44_9ACTN|nr:RidA family protein [Microlunatus capsulatus]MBP2418236.1 enamine deaminase RidA (YjgF/YER057c/UK114 family) [Microlunatus capsulatus]